jgi:hypothetical protein
MASRRSHPDDRPECLGCGSALQHDPYQDTYRCPSCHVTFRARCIDCGVPFNGVGSCRDCADARADAEAA